jgi:beta-lactamase regulating signal transducer with metallopeptidase domain/HEAT repeat protein
MDDLASGLIRLLGITSGQLLILALLLVPLLRTGIAGSGARRVVLGLAVLVPFLSVALLLRPAPAQPCIAVPVSASWLPRRDPPVPAVPRAPLPVHAVVPESPAPGAGPPPAAETPVRSTEPLSLEALLALAWAAGVLLAMGRAAVALRCVRRSVRGATPVRRAELLGRLREWAGEQGLSRMPQLRSLPGKVVPFVAGVLRPVIVVPDRLLATGEEERLEFAVRHEMAHVHARDGFWVLPELLLRAVWFFHPAVHLLLGWVWEEREHAADLAVAEATGRPGAYASFLLGEQRRSMALRGALPATALWRRAGSTARRIRRLAERREKTMLRSTLSKVFPAIAVAALVVVVLLRPVVVRAEDEAPVPKERIEALVSGYRAGTSPENRDRTIRLLAIGEEAIPQLLAAARDEGFPGRANAAVALARLLRALGRPGGEVSEILRELAAGGEEHARTYGRWGLEVLAQETPLGDGSEGGRDLAPEAIARALRDGNEHLKADNVLVDQLLLHGKEAIEPLVRAIRDRSFSGRGYAAWALAVVMFGTESSTDAGWAALQEAARDSSGYVHALARSGMSLFVTRRIAVRGSAGTVAVPGRGAAATSLLEALGKGSPRAVSDALVARGREAIPALTERLRGGSPAERRRAAALLGRILRAAGDPPETTVAALREAARSEDPALVEAAGEALRNLERETPLDGEGSGAIDFTPERLVRSLRDGNEHRLADNILVDMLLMHGEAALVPLVEAAADETFPGRGYAAWALGCLLGATGTDSPEALAVLRAASRARSPYVRALSLSALRCLED